MSTIYIPPVLFDPCVVSLNGPSIVLTGPLIITNQLSLFRTPVNQSVIYNPVTGVYSFQGGTYTVALSVLFESVPAGDPVAVGFTSTPISALLIYNFPPVYDPLITSQATISVESQPLFYSPTPFTAHFALSCTSALVSNCAITLIRISPP